MCSSHVAFPLLMSACGRFARNVCPQPEHVSVDKPRMLTPADRAAWLLAALIALRFGWVELDELAERLACVAPFARA